MRRHKRPRLSEAEAALFRDGKVGARVVALKHGCCARTAYRALHDAGVPPLSPGRAKYLLTEAEVRAYREGKSARSVREALARDISERTVRQRLAEAGLLRSRKEAARLRAEASARNARTKRKPAEDTHE